jgi:hypothetical protein
MSESKLKDVTLRITRVKSGTKEEAVLNFVRSQELMPMRQLLLFTLKMCWLPFSYQYQGADEQTQQNAARQAMYQLEYHLDYLAETFNLDRASKRGQEKTPSLAPATQVSEKELLGQADIHSELGEYDLGSLEFGD